MVPNHYQAIDSHLSVSHHPFSKVFMWRYLTENVSLVVVQAEGKAGQGFTDSASCALFPTGSYHSHCPINFCQTSPYWRCGSPPSRAATPNFSVYYHFMDSKTTGMLRKVIMWISFTSKYRFLSYLRKL